MVLGVSSKEEYLGRYKGGNRIEHGNYYVIEGYGAEV